MSLLQHAFRPTLMLQHQVTPETVPSISLFSDMPLTADLVCGRLILSLAINRHTSLTSQTHRTVMQHTKLGKYLDDRLHAHVHYADGSSQSSGGN